MTADFRLCRKCGGLLDYVGHDTHPSRLCTPAGEVWTDAVEQNPGAVLRDQGIAATTAAHPSALQAATAIIRDAARANETLSANLCRPEMDLAQVPGPVRGAAWRQAVADGLVEHIGWTPSSQKETHAHHLGQYRSLIYTGRAA